MGFATSSLEGQVCPSRRPSSVSAISASPFDNTWAFVLRERQDGTTRLLVRERYAYLRPWAPLIVEPTAVLAFLMSERLLREIRDRAERAAVR